MLPFTTLPVHRCASTAEMVSVLAGTGCDGCICCGGIAAWQATALAWRGSFLYLQGVHVDHHPRMSVGGGLHRESRVQTGW